MSTSNYLSPLRVEADQKEIIISQLKEELYHLKRNEQEFYNLEDQYRQLEHKYRLLNQEKVIGDSDYKSRHEAALKAICSHKAELDDLKAELRDRNLELNDLQTDQNTLRNQLDQRNIELDKLKVELNSLFADGDEMAVARANLQSTVEKTRQANSLLAQKIHELDIQNEEVLRKVADTEKYLGQLLDQERLLKDKILSYQNENNGLDGDINADSNDIATLDGRILDAQAMIKRLQSEIAEADALVNKYKSEALHYHKSAQGEVMKNNDTAKMLAQAENISKVRMHEIEEGKGVIAGLNGENDKISITNRRLEDDLEFCRKHLENLALINQDIVFRLEKFSDEDEDVRRLIDRRQVVERSRCRIQETSILLNNTTVTEFPPHRRPKNFY